MNGLKKWMVVLMTGVTLMGNVIGMGTTVIASKNETQESLSGVDVYMPENGSLERVIRVYEDGSFVTEPINDIRTYATNTPCEHPARYLEARGKKTDFQTVGTAGICYKERLIISNKCKKCNRIGIKTYSPWIRGKDDVGNEISFNLISYRNPELIFELAEPGSARNAKKLTLQLYQYTENEESNILYKKEDYGDFYAEEIGKEYNENQSPEELAVPVGNEFTVDLQN